MNVFLAIVVVIGAQSADPDAGPAPAPTPPAPAGDVVGEVVGDGAEPAPPATSAAPAETEGPAPAAPDAVTPPAPDAPPAPAPPAPAPAAAPTVPAPAPPPQTQWTPLDEEVESMASGMLGVCETLILPISIIPAVGEYVGLAAEWACIVPAAFAVQHTALHHGDRSPHLWQIVIALSAQKLWQTVVALPVPFVLIAAASVGLTLGGLGVYFGLPAGISLGLLLSPLTLTYLISKGLEKEGGRFIFSRMYDLFDEGLRNEEHARAAEESWIGPRQDGAAGVVYLVATADGASAPFEPQFLIPVVGPVLKGQAEARTTQARMRRAGVEVLGEAKHDLSGMDSVTDVLMGAESTFMAIGQAGLIASFSMIGVSLVLFQRGDQDNAEVFGALGALGSIVAASFVGLAQVPDALKPCCVPAAYMLAPVAEKYPDPRVKPEVPPPPRAPPAAPPLPAPPATEEATPEAGAPTQEAATPLTQDDAPPPPASAPSPNPPP